MSKTQNRPTKAHNSTETPTASGRKYVPILGVKIDSSLKGELLKKAQTCLGLASPYVPGAGYFIVTPNPEIITRATRDGKLLSSLNSADLALPDGIGVIWAMKYLSETFSGNGVIKMSQSLLRGLTVGMSILFNRKWLTSESEVVPGRIFMEDLIADVAKKGNGRIFLLGGRSGVAELAAKVLSKKYGLSEIKADAGPWLDENGEPVNETEKETEREVIRKINAYAPDLLFVAFGPPKQEKWLVRNLPHLKVGIAMTVGGSLDYIAGIVPEPPRFVSDAGFEWLWRLITQPWRAGRIFTAVVMFPLKVLLQSIR